MRKRYCYHCGKLFYGRKIVINPLSGIESVYCSDECDEEVAKLDVLEDVGEIAAMRKRYCYHCGRVFYGRKVFVNPQSGIESVYCSDKCDEEVARLDVLEDVGLESEPDQIANPTCVSSSQSKIPLQDVETTHCWHYKCNGTVLRLPQFADPPYGHKCQSCGHSLRDNPVYGEGAPRDCKHKRACAVSY